MTRVPPPVRALLAALSDAVSGKDLEAATRLFWDEAIVSGSSEDELAVDDQLPAFLQGVFSLGVDLRWDWEEPVVRQHGDVAWFYCEGTLNPSNVKPMPYRATGVVRVVDGEWRFGQWSGAEPA